MALSRTGTEAQLKQAREVLELYAKKLESTGTAKKEMKKDPKWRKLDAKARQIQSRIRKIGEVETLNAEVLKHKEERQTELAAKKAAKKVKKPKAEPVKAAKSEGKKGDKADKGAKKKSEKGA